MGEPQDFYALAKENESFRREIVTGEHSQLVVMTVPAGGEIGEEVHEVDQWLLFVEGEGEAVLEGETSPVRERDLVLVRAGTRHNFVSKGVVPLRLVTIYAPPEHEPGTVHATKEEADAAEGH